TLLPKLGRLPQTSQVAATVVLLIFSLAQRPAGLRAMMVGPLASRRLGQPDKSTRRRSDGSIARSRPLSGDGPPGRGRAMWGCPAGLGVVARRRPCVDVGGRDSSGAGRPTRPGRR